MSQNLNIIDLKTSDIQHIRSIVEILNGIVTDANVDFTKDKNANKEKLPTSDEDVKENKKKKKKKEENKKVSKKNKKKDINVDNQKKSDEENPGQMKILTTDASQTLIAYIELAAADFDRFNVYLPEYRVGLNVDELFKYIKNVDKDGSMDITVPADDTQNIMFSVYSQQSSKVSKCELKVLNLDENKRRHIEAEYTMTVRISCNEFHRVCKDLSQFSTHIEILCDPDIFSITCRGEMSKHSRIYKNDGSENGVTISCTKKNEDIPDIVKLIVEIKYINMMSKCGNLCKEMVIYLKPKSVMFLRYGIALNSRMLVGIAPASAKEDHLTNNKHYDESLDDYYEDEEIRLK
jgi:proliferating cell nuclear antigen PCNA